jgi:outer membrane biosynthesis protein TonB
MSILQLPTRPPRDPNLGEPDLEDKTGEDVSDDWHARLEPIPASRYADLETHELIHLLDSIDDERARARFRESVYISIIIWLAVAWFLFYGPHVLFHQPYYKDVISLMKEHDKQQLTYLTPTAPPAPRTPPRIDRKTMEALRKQMQAPPTPQPPAPQPATPQPQPQEQAHNVAPPVPQPAMPLPAAPKAPAPSVSAPLPAAPAPNFARNESAKTDLERAMRGALTSRGSGITSPGAAAGPLQSGTQILSDTQGVDFTAYMRRLHDDVQRNWDPLIPLEVQPPILKKGIVGLRFSILPDGQIGDMKLETTSGDVALDKAAWWAITSEGQFPPLPKAFHGPDLELRVGFFYNQPIE